MKPFPEFINVKPRKCLFCGVMMHDWDVANGGRTVDLICGAKGCTFRLPFAWMGWSPVNGWGLNEEKE